MVPNATQRTRWTPGIVLLACLAVSLVCVVYPIYVIRPFRAQGARELAWALGVARFRPAVTVVCAAVALLGVALFWRGLSTKWRRIGYVSGAVLACVLAYLARVNVYEIMFHPIEGASFSSAQGAKLASREKVIAVNFGGAARAYPVRIMSYHHLINDMVDKFAIVATY